MNGVNGDNHVKRLVRKIELLGISDLYKWLHIFHSVLDGVFRNINAGYRNTGNQLTQVMEHKALATANIKQGAVSGEAKMLLEIRNHWLPETGLIAEPAIPMAAVAIKIIFTKLPPNRAVFLCFLRGPFIQVPFCF